MDLSIRNYSGNEVLFVDVCFACTTYAIICTLPSEPSTREPINKRATSVFIDRHVGRLYIYTDRGPKVSDLFIKCSVVFLASPPPPYRQCASVPPLPRRCRPLTKIVFIFPLKIHRREFLFTLNVLFFCVIICPVDQLPFVRKSK